MFAGQNRLDTSLLIYEPPTGIDPVTSFLPRTRSTTELGGQRENTLPADLPDAKSGIHQGSDRVSRGAISLRNSRAKAEKSAGGQGTSTPRDIRHELHHNSFPTGKGPAAIAGGRPFSAPQGVVITTCPCCCSFVRLRGGGGGLRHRGPCGSGRHGLHRSCGRHGPCRRRGSHRCGRRRTSS